MLVSPKEVELGLFFLDVSNECESSLSLMSILTWCLVLWSDTEDSKSCTPTEASQALFHWVFIEVLECCGITKVVLGHG